MNTLWIQMALKLVDTTLLVAELRAEDRAELEASANILRTMIREGRGPTDAEWAEWNAVSDRIIAELTERANRT